MLDLVTVTRYVTPLREGGSLPAIVEADNLGTYVMKFRGAGQGPLALVAEMIAGELARLLGLRVPELVLAELDPRIPGSEPDPEIQDLLKASSGLNLGVDFLPGSAGSIRWAGPPTTGSRAGCCGSMRSSRTRTAPGATPTCWSGTATSGSSTTAPRCTSTTTGQRPIRRGRSTADYVLRDRATRLAEAHEALIPLVTESLLDEVTALVPPAGSVRRDRPRTCRTCWRGRRWSRR